MVEMVKEELKKNKEKSEQAEESLDSKSSAEETVQISKKEYEELLKCKGAQEKLLYVCADFDNYKKRSAKDLEQQVCYANEKLIKEVLPIMDNLSRAREHAKSCDDSSKEQFDKFLEGIDLVFKQIMTALKKFGVEEVCSVGEKFDPNYHEAMDHRESKDHDNGVVMPMPPCFELVVASKNNAAYISFSIQFMGCIVQGQREYNAFTGLKCEFPDGVLILFYLWTTCRSKR